MQCGRGQKGKGIERKRTTGAAGNANANARRERNGRVHMGTHREHKTKGNARNAGAHGLDKWTQQRVMHRGASAINSDLNWRRELDTGFARMEWRRVG